MTSDSGSLSGLLRKAEFEPASALAGYRKALGQRLMGGVSGAEVMAALTEFVDGLIIGRHTFETVLSFDAWPYGEKRVFVLSTRP